MHIGVLFSTPFPPEEGIGFYVQKLSEGLYDRGHEITLITRGGITRDIDQHGGITVVKAPFLPVYPFHVDIHGFFVNRILDQMNQDLDVIHVHSPLAPRIEASLPIVLTVHTTVVEDAKHKEALTPSVILNKLVTRISSRRIIAGQINNAACVTTVSASVKQKLNEHYGVADALVVGNGVDSDMFHPAERTADTDSFVFSVGRLNYGKGFSDLIEAMGLLASRDEQLPTLSIAGEGPLENSLKAQASEAGVRENVSFIGFRPQEELIPLYQDATMFVLPSRYEGLPTVLLEAMACGSPVIATNISGSAEVVTDGDNGVLVPPGQPAAMADAILSLLHDPDRRQNLGRRARRTVEKSFTWHAIVDKFENMFQQVVARK